MTKKSTSSTPQVTADVVAKPAVNQAKGPVKAGDEMFMRDLHGALLIQKNPLSTLILWLIAAVIIVAVTWAHFAIVEEITVGEGKVIPASREQVIQSLEGGILEELDVREGEVVEKGQPLLKIDPTRSAASYREALSKVQGLKGTIARLRAEAYGTPLIFPEGIEESIVRDETQAYNSRKTSLNETVASLQHSLNLAQSEVNLSEPLARKGLVSEVEILRLRRQANEFNMQIVERTNRFRADANNELTKMESELAQAEQILAGRQDVMERTTIVAPVRGTVNNIKVTTHGGVIQQGAEIMTLIPLEDRLLVEAKIKPSDVAFFTSGSACDCKKSPLTTTPFTAACTARLSISVPTPFLMKRKHAPDGVILTFIGFTYAQTRRSSAWGIKPSRLFLAWWLRLKYGPAKNLFSLICLNLF